MDGKEGNYPVQNFNEGTLKLRSLEEKQNILKDRLLLIGQNLLEMKEKNLQDTLEIKKQVQLIKQELEKIKTFLGTISNEFSKFARKEDLEILQKQARMFQPFKN